MQGAYGQRHGPLLQVIRSSIEGQPINSGNDGSAHVPPCNPSTVTMTINVAQEELLANDNSGDEDDIEDIGDEVPRTPPTEDRILV
ncbi:hypothetical protein FH972_006075 [Carpinus fangiana]|uniref:Uncharacterized protein n=1 Tax=Carpinus fangiana TaxID=176857 RepID=A0A5N6QTJ8_9ROSI|nr:hypothetical protein FH972_006075 [Carpinus fangiana]